MVKTSSSLTVVNSIPGFGSCEKSCILVSGKNEEATQSLILTDISCALILENGIRTIYHQG